MGSSEASSSATEMRGYGASSRVKTRVSGTEFVRRVRLYGSGRPLTPWTAMNRPERKEIKKKIMVSGAAIFFKICLAAKNGGAVERDIFVIKNLITMHAHFR